MPFSPLNALWGADVVVLLRPAFYRYLALMGETGRTKDWWNSLLLLLQKGEEDGALRLQPRPGYMGGSAGGSAMWGRPGSTVWGRTLWGGLRTPWGGLRRRRRWHPTSPHAQRGPAFRYDPMVNYSPTGAMLQRHQLSLRHGRSSSKFSRPQIFVSQGLSRLLSTRDGTFDGRYILGGLWQRGTSR
jgi:hypothetical protein